MEAPRLEKLLQEISQLNEMASVKMRSNRALASEFFNRLSLSWIFHDCALEGVVLSLAELNAAIDDMIISNTILIPSYDDVRHYYDAIDFVLQSRNKKKTIFDLAFVKKLHLIVSYGSDSREGSGKKRSRNQYRNDHPLHRLYFHTITPPDKISYQLRKAILWLRSPESKNMHPVEKAALAHGKIMEIFPWSANSGKVARLLMNAILLRDGFLPAVIHSVDRQRYYESLKRESQELISLVAEAALRTLHSADQYFEERERRAD